MFLKVNEHLELEALTEGYEDDIFRLTQLNRDYLTEWLPWVEDTTSVRDSLDFIQHTLREAEAKVSLTFVIKADQQMIGMTDLHRIDNEKGSAAIGYWLEEKSQGKGIMTTVCRTLTDFGFNGLGLNRVEIECATDNVKSQAIPLRLAFTEEGVLKEAAVLQGRYVDHYLYAMTKERWAELNSVPEDESKET